MHSKVPIQRPHFFLPRSLKAFQAFMLFSQAGFSQRHNTLSQLAAGAMLTAAAFVLVVPAKAGNEDRIGQAGATELLINPWARSSGWAGLNTASITGIEAERFNVAGMAFNPKENELNFSQTTWLQGSGVTLSAFGYARRMRGESVLGLSFMSVNFGEIPVTTYQQPEGGLGNFRPGFFNLGITYAKKFSDKIYAGALVRIISQSIPDANSQGMAFDAGIQYHVPGDRLKFGIALRNVGTPMRFSGEGLAFRTEGPNSGTSPGGNYTITVQQRADRFELPSMMNIGIHYELIKVDSTPGSTPTHGLSAVANFTSNSFSRDQYGLGLEYRFRDWLGIRGGYNYESKLTDDIARTTALTGVAFGATLKAPLVKNVENQDKNVSFALDYSYRTSNPFAGCHSIGARLLF